MPPPTDGGVPMPNMPEEIPLEPFGADEVPDPSNATDNTVPSEPDDSSIESPIVENPDASNTAEEGGNAPLPEPAEPTAPEAPIVIDPPEETQPDVSGPGTGSYLTNISTVVKATPFYVAYIVGNVNNKNPPSEAFFETANATIEYLEQYFVDHYHSSDVGLSTRTTINFEGYVTTIMDAVKITENTPWIGYDAIVTFSTQSNGTMSQEQLQLPTRATIDAIVMQALANEPQELLDRLEGLPLRNPFSKTESVAYWSTLPKTDTAKTPDETSTKQTTNETDGAPKNVDPAPDATEEPDPKGSFYIPYVIAAGAALISVALFVGILTIFRRRRHRKASMEEGPSLQDIKGFIYSANAHRMASSSVASVPDEEEGMTSDDHGSAALPTSNNNNSNPNNPFSDTSDSDEETSDGNVHPAL